MGQGRSQSQWSHVTPTDRLTKAGKQYTYHDTTTNHAPRHAPPKISSSQIQSASLPLPPQSPPRAPRKFPRNHHRGKQIPAYQSNHALLRRRRDPPPPRRPRRSHRGDPRGRRSRAHLPAEGGPAVPRRARIAMPPRPDRALTASRGSPLPSVAWSRRNRNHDP
jgi:hypothetical protein